MALKPVWEKNMETGEEGMIMKDLPDEPTMPPAKTLEDLKTDYATAKDDAERLGIIAKKLGLV